MAVKKIINKLEKLLDKADALESVDTNRSTAVMTAYNAHELSIWDLSPLPPKHIDKKQIKEMTEYYVERLQELQRIMYAQGKYSLLIVLQGMDAAGKDSTISKVFTGINPLGCQVVSFKAPTEKELAHDYLWRVHAETPARGMIKIFNRSHYEDILVPTIEGYVSKDKLIKRYDDVNNFEQMLQNNDTIILKFYLHISHKEQIKKLKERIDNPEKHFKHNDSDRTSSEKFDKYLEVYDSVFDKCSVIPWHIIPSNEKRYKIYLVVKTIVETLEQYDLKFPEMEK